MIGQIQTHQDRYTCLIGIDHDRYDRIEDCLGVFFSETIRRNYD